MTSRTTGKRELSRHILAGLMAARQLQEYDVAERLLQALEVMAADGEDDDLSTAYLELVVAPTPAKGLQ